MTRSKTVSQPVVGQSYKRSSGITWTVQAVDQHSVTFECSGSTRVVSLKQWARHMAVVGKEQS